MLRHLFEVLGYFGEGPAVHDPRQVVHVIVRAVSIAQRRGQGGLVARRGGGRERSSARSFKLDWVGPLDGGSRRSLGCGRRDLRWLGVDVLSWLRRGDVSLLDDGL